MGKLSSETNSHQQLTFRHSLQMKKKKNCLLTTGLIIRKVIVSFLGSKQERLVLLFGINPVVNSSELLSSPGSQRNLKG